MTSLKHISLENTHNFRDLGGYPTANDRATKRGVLKELMIAISPFMHGDFGKALDPIADKLTQIAMLFCLVSRFEYMIVPLTLLIVKEVCTGITRYD